jgi:glycosyltransferase involved in cell wall biosynthesis
MHYCYLLTHDTYGAAAFRMAQLGGELIKRGHRVSYIANDADEPERRGKPGEKIPPDATVELIPRGSQLKAVVARRAALKRLKPDYVEVLNPHPQTLLPLAGLRGPRVVALWDEPQLVYDLSFRRRTAARAWNRWLLGRAWLKITAARELQQLLRERYGAEAVYLPHVNYLRPQPDGASPFDRPTFVYLGTFTPIWDHDVIFEAARILRERGQTPAICMIGSGADRPRWEAFVRQHHLDNVQLAGFLDEPDLWRHLRHAHALLFPMRDTLLNRSRCSSKLFAYAQARRPVIANRVGEAPQILGEQGVTWIGQSPEAFADAIERASSQPTPPDVENDLERLSPARRVDELLEAIARRERAGK